MTLDIFADMATPRLEHGVVSSDVSARNDSRSTDQSSADVRQNVAVQVAADNNIELVGL